MKMKRFKMMLVAVVAIFALMLGTEKASAQSGLSDNILTPPTGNWVSTPEALGLLGQQVVNLKSFLLTLTPGTAAYKTVERSVFTMRICVEVDSMAKTFPPRLWLAWRNISTDALALRLRPNCGRFAPIAIDMLSQ
jgi:hypothetical protein